MPGPPAEVEGEEPHLARPMTAPAVAAVEFVGYQVGEAAEPDGPESEAAPQEHRHEGDPAEGMGGGTVGEDAGDEGEEQKVEVREEAAEKEAAAVEGSAGGVEGLRGEVGDGKVGDGFQESPDATSEGSLDPGIAPAMVVFYQSVGRRPM